MFQVSQPDNSVLQGRHGVPADVRSHQPAELPQCQKLDEYVVNISFSLLFGNLTCFSLGSSSDLVNKTLQCRGPFSLSVYSHIEFYSR